MKVSVIINTIDRAQYLKDTLSSLLLQSFKDLEIIVVIGPTKDNTIKIVKQFQRLCSNVIILETNERNLSISRNIGLVKAKGEFVAFIDDDAIPDKFWVQQLVNDFQKNNTKNLSALGGVVQNDKDDRLQFRHGFVGIWGEIHALNNEDKGYNRPNGYYFNTVMGTNMIFRKDYL